MPTHGRSARRPAAMGRAGAGRARRIRTSCRSTRIWRGGNGGLTRGRAGWTRKSRAVARLEKWGGGPHKAAEPKEKEGTISKNRIREDSSLRSSWLSGRIPVYFTAEARRAQSMGG